MWFSRHREFRADAGGAQLAGRGKMISALERLAQQYGEPAQLPEAVKAFGISGSAGWGLKRLFMSHPPLEERIAALRAAPKGSNDSRLKRSLCGAAWKQRKVLFQCLISGSFKVPARPNVVRATTRPFAPTSALSFPLNSPPGRCPPHRSR